MERRSCWPLTLCLLVVLITGLLVNMHFKTELVNKLKNEMEFADSAVRDGELGVKNYDLAAEHTQKEMESAEKEVKELQDEVGKLNSAKEAKDNEVKACKDSEAALNNDVAAVEKEKTDTDGKFADEKTKWGEEVNGLKKQFQEKSPVCAHVNVTDENEKQPILKDLCFEIQTVAQA